MDTQCFIILPGHIMYLTDWEGWLKRNNVPGSWNINSNYILFDDPADALAFRLTFGL